MASSPVIIQVATPGPAGPAGPSGATGAAGYSPRYYVQPGVPTSGVGLTGDMYINSTTSDVWGPKIDNTTWPATPACNIRGIAGYSPLYIVAAGTPPGATGNIGDMYINSTTSDLYGPKSAGGWGPIVANLKGSTGSTGPQGPPGVAYTPRGAWNSATTYVQGDLVSDAGIAYIALQSANVNHVPLSSPTWWQAVAAGGTQTPWNSNIDAGGFKLYNAGGIGIGIGSVAGVPANTLCVHSPTRVATLATFTANDGNPSNLSTPSIGLGVSAAQLWGVITGQQTSGGTYGEGSLAFSTRAGDVIVERIRILWNGNVGIGTASPSALLSLLTAAGTATTLDFTQLGNAKWTISIPASVGALAFSQQTSEFMRITNAGNVGIGTTSPAVPLHIASDVTRQLYLTSSSDPVNKQMRIGYDVTNNTCVVECKPGGPASFLLFNPSGGNVGIGTVNPAGTLEVQRSQTDGGAILRLAVGPTNGFTFSRNEANGALNLQGNQIGFNNIVLCPTSGNVGIGFPAPTAKLVVLGTAADASLTLNQELVQVAAATGVILAMGVGSSFNTPWIQSKFLNAGDGRFFPLALNPAGGNVGIGTASPATRLHVSGPSGAPSAASDTGVALFQTDALTQLAIGGINGGSYGVWLQTKYISNNGSSWPLCLNPVGGRVSVGNTAPQGLFSINPVTNATTVATATQLVIGEQTNSSGFYLSLGYMLEASVWKGSIQAVSQGGGAAPLILNGLGGNVGVAKLAPAYALDVAGEVNATGFRINGTPIATGGGSITTQSVVTVSRVLGTTYPNATGKPMFVSVHCNVIVGQSVSLYADGGSPPTQRISSSSNSGSVPFNFSVCGWVLPGHNYRVVSTSGSITDWVEWT